MKEESEATEVIVGCECLDETKVRKLRSVKTEIVL